jgi:HEAT repeat protein
MRPLHVPTIMATILISLLLICPRNAPSQDMRKAAWDVLQAGIGNKAAGERAAAVNALGLLRNDSQAVDFAEKALDDKDPVVLAAAMTALGQMASKKSIPKIKETAKKSTEGGVILAGAHALIVLGDTSAYEVYYAVLTGERKSGASLMEEQAKTLKDPKKMAQFGFEAGIGFIPFASAGLGVVKAVSKDDISPVRAAAARNLATDTDPRSGKALVQAASDKSPLVRAAALDAIARRGDASLVSSIKPALSDSKSSVRYTAAAAVLRLSAKP